MLHAMIFRRVYAHLLKTQDCLKKAGRQFLVLLIYDVELIKRERFKPSCGVFDVGKANVRNGRFAEYAQQI